MRWRRPAGTRSGIGRLGIALLILSLVHTPLPQPDFHKNRHQDGPGQVCEHHDHLLRWHPGAAAAQDVAVLHWHWFLPLPSGESPAPESSGLAIHAHTTPWQAAAWDDGPRLVTPDNASRSLPRPAPCPLDLPLTVPGPALFGFMPPCGSPPPLAFSATFAPSVSRCSLLQRWVC